MAELKSAVVGQWERIDALKPAYVGELTAQLKEVSFGVERIGTAERTGPTSASATLTTLEKTSLTVEMDAAGVRVTQPMRSPTYDCVNSLLLNESGAFRDAFNEQLSEMLSEVARERGVG